MKDGLAHAQAVLDDEAFAVALPCPAPPVLDGSEGVESRV